MTFVIREMEAADLPHAFEVRVATWHNERGREELTALGITPQSVTRMLAETHRGWVAECDERIVGFAMGNQQTGEMWVIAVLREFEGRGLGRALLGRVEDWLWETWSEIWLTTDLDETLRAVGFYRRLGWVDWKLADGDRYMQKRRPA